MSYQCNGCLLERKHRELGEDLLILPGSVIYFRNGITLYRLDAAPIEGQGEKVEHGGRPVKFIAWLAAGEHSCGKPAPVFHVALDSAGEVERLKLCEPCGACERVAPLVGGECPDCRH